MVPPLDEDRVLELLQRLISERDKGKATSWMRQTVLMLLAGAISVTGTTTTILTYKPEDIEAIAYANDFKEYKDRTRIQLDDLNQQVQQLVANQNSSKNVSGDLRECQANMSDLRARMNAFEHYQKLIIEYGGKKNAG